jgi:hypothetical protein
MPWGMDREARLRRREEARRRIQRQRRIAAAAVLSVAVGGVVVAGTALFAGGSGDSAEAGAVELPRGGKQILPRNQVVAFYGAPQDAELGALGIGRPSAAARRLERQARAYRASGKPVLPAFELIATVANDSPGSDGQYSTRQSSRTISRYLRAARAHKALLVLDIQPGRSDFMTEARAYRRFLEQPDVSLALDPEWRMDPGQVPGRQIGSTDAATVNEVSRWLAGIVKRKGLPQKLLVVHRFTKGMIRDERRLKRRPGIALTVNIDGFGTRAQKVAKYREFTRGQGRRRLNGFKLFYREDTNLMRARDVLRLRPHPDFVVYE